MLFSEIHPFVRFARYQTFRGNVALRPYDCRLFYVEKGEAQFTVLGETCVLGATDALLIFPGVEYQWVEMAKDAQVLAFNFDFTFRHSAKSVPIPPDEPDCFVEKHILEKVSFSDLPELQNMALVRGMGKESGALLKCHNEFLKQLKYSVAAASAHFCRFLLAFARKLTEPAESKSATLEEMISYLNDHLTETVTNAQLAELFHYHPNYISSLIRAKTGMPLKQYLLNQRIMRAIMLLETTQMSVTQIAEEVGFCDVSYFSNYFKKATGRTPKEFR